MDDIWAKTLPQSATNLRQIDVVEFKHLLALNAQCIECPDTDFKGGVYVPL